MEAVINGRAIKGRIGQKKNLQSGINRRLFKKPRSRSLGSESRSKSTGDKAEELPREKCKLSIPSLDEKPKPKRKPQLLSPSAQRHLEQWRNLRKLAVGGLERDRTRAEQWVEVATEIFKYAVILVLVAVTCHDVSALVNQWIERPIVAEMKFHSAEKIDFGNVTFCLPLSAAQLTRSALSDMVRFHFGLRVFIQMTRAILMVPRRRPGPQGNAVPCAVV